MYLRWSYQEQRNNAVVAQRAGERREKILETCGTDNTMIPRDTVNHGDTNRLEKSAAYINAIK